MASFCAYSRQNPLPREGCPVDPGTHPGWIQRRQVYRRLAEVPFAGVSDYLERRLAGLLGSPWGPGSCLDGPHGGFLTGRRKAPAPCVLSRGSGRQPRPVAQPFRNLVRESPRNRVISPLLGASCPLRVFGLGAECTARLRWETLRRSTRKGLRTR